MLGSTVRESDTLSDTLSLCDTLELSIDNVPIEQVSSVKSLGIYVDENLTWHFHIDKLCKKIASAIGAIK